MHNKYLMDKGFTSAGYGTKREMQSKGMRGKQAGRYKAYRVVPYGKKYELYVKR